jgi:hypothetical protein
MQLALSDFHAARHETGPYYAFYAYRVLEDVGYLFGAKDDHPNWDAMNAALNTCKQKWETLTDAGTAARHLDEGKFQQSKGATRQDLIALSHEALTLAFAHFGIFRG